ncbi:hypothetical protein L914_08201 [Phytophthora nicotianae]|nr:hypothetical protein F443_08481 [Phytophthora nicotianae P1569]ETL40632.1 hypothetical protein L916_08240 [Phytophthora nicotianae]ETM47014.1 hypothetical protein L914_08201 [Phytophthora nicotianae]
MVTFLSGDLSTFLLKNVRAEIGKIMPFLVFTPSPQLFKTALDSKILYYAEKMYFANFRQTHTFVFQPWPKDVTLAIDPTQLVPLFQLDDEHVGKRGLKPGPTPQHRHKRARNRLIAEYESP